MEIGCPHIQELALLRDALYLLQGISGKHVRFATGKDGEAEMSLLFMEGTVGLIVRHFLAIDHPFQGIFDISPNQAADT